MNEVVPINSNHPFVGKWLPADDMCDIEVSIYTNGCDFEISAVDKSDNEAAEVSNIKFENELMHFTLYWATTGRQVSYRFMLQSKNTVNVTYTYTGTEIWLRSET